MQRLKYITLWFFRIIILLVVIADLAVFPTSSGIFYEIIPVLSIQGPVYDIIPDKQPSQNNGEASITISFAGDCTFGTDLIQDKYELSFYSVFEKQNNDFSYFFRNVHKIFASDDLTLVNFEGTLTTAEIPANKVFRFKGDPSYVNILKAGSIEAVNLANNHTRDYLSQGFLDTVATLDKAGIMYSWEGDIAYFRTKSTTIASMGYSIYDGPEIAKKLKNDIKEARKKAVIVIVSFHWKKDYVNIPEPLQQDLGRSAIDMGADIVVGHHPHVIQGIEYYKDRYIVHSLGNFCFGGNPNPRDYDTFIFQNTFTVKDGVIKSSKGNIIPCSISSDPETDLTKKLNNYQPVVLEAEEKERVLDRLYEYSSKLKYGIVRNQE